MSFSIVTENTRDCAHSGDLLERFGKAANDNAAMPSAADSREIIALSADRPAWLDQYK